MTTQEISKMVVKRVQNHIDEHEGLYTEEDLKTLRPIWEKQVYQDAIKALSK